jgi:PAS domain S-box-containing protein
VDLKRILRRAPEPAQELKKATPKPKIVERVDPSKRINLGKRVRIMLIEDKQEDRDGILQALYGMLNNVEIVETPFAESASRTIVGMGIFDVCIMDWQTSPANAKNLLDFLKLKQPHIPVVVLTQTWSEEMATDAVRAGADYCMVKASGYAKILPYVIEQRFKQSFAIQEKITGEIGDSYQEARRKYFDAMSQLVILVKQDGKLIDVNKATLDLLHITRERLIGEDCEKLFRHESGVESFFPTSKVFESGQQMTVERYDPTLDRYFRVTTVPVREEDQMEFLNVLEDITTEKTREADPLRTLSTAFGQIEQPLFYKDAQGRFIYANGAYARLLQTDPAQLAGRTEREVTDAERAARHEESEKAALEAGETVMHEELVAGRWLAYEVTPVRDLAGAALGIVGIVRDVTETKRTGGPDGMGELGRLADLAAELVFELDKNGAITFASASALHLTGHGRDELLGASFAEALLGTAEKERWRGLLERVVTDGDSVSREEMVVFRKDSSAFPAEVSLAPIAGEDLGDVVGVRGLLRDASDAKRLRRALEILQGKGE